MAPAIRHAVDGFPVYLTLAQFIEENEDKLKRYKGSANTFWPDGEPLQAGELLVQSELAATLSKISEGGADRFYSGEQIGRASCREGLWSAEGGRDRRR